MKYSLKQIKNWHMLQRYAYKEGKLEKYKENILKKNGFDFTISIANQFKEFLSFEKAREIVHSFNLKNREEWNNFCDTGKLPDNIPLGPSLTYKENWVSWGDWLGTNRIANQLKEFLPFNEAKEFIHLLGIKTENEWREYLKKDLLPNNIPHSPQSAYKDEWISMGDWLGTGAIAPQFKEFLSFNEAREKVRLMRFKGTKDWIAFTKTKKFPSLKIPAYPNRYDEWISMADWLGIKETKNILEYEKAKKIIHSFGLKNKKEYQKLIFENKYPLPLHPSQVYRKTNQWKSWGDFLGYEIGKVDYYGEYLAFNAAKEKVKLLGLTSNKQWKEIWNKNEKYHNIPKFPDTYYKGWKGWRDFLGYENWLPFEEARNFSQSLGLKMKKNWKEYVSSGNLYGKNIPSWPDRVYDNWIGWNDWLGCQNEFMTYDEAKSFLKDKGFREPIQYYEFQKNNKQNRLPVRAQTFYQNRGWVSWEDFLNFQPLSFEKAKEIVKSLGIRTMKEYKNRFKEHSLLPCHPDCVFSNKWKNWGEFLGSDFIPFSQRKYIPFSQVKEFAKQNNIVGQISWKEFIKSGKKPDNIPSNLELVYKKSGEWRGWHDFLGKTKP